MREKQIDLILKQLGMKEDADGVVGVLFDAWVEVARATANRTDYPEALLGIVRDVVVAAYHRRGDEGAASASAGGQSYTYDELSDTLVRRIVSANLRVFRP